MDVKEAGKRGGDSTKKKYGKEHYSKLGKKGGEKTKERWAALKQLEKQES